MQTTHSINAPQAVGPYSQAIEHDGLIYCSGQIALDPHSGELVNGGIREHAHRVLSNLSEVLKEAGSSLDKALRVEIFLHDMNDYEELNAVYSEYFDSETLPARFVVEVSRLPKEALIEIACIAHQ